MWYYLRDGESQGPFDEESFRQLVTQGIVTPASQVWNENLAGWIALSQVHAGSASADSPSTCAICHARVGAENLISLNNVLVCAACKPLVVQKMREGVNVAVGTAWRDGKKVVIHDKARLPARCVKCNAETNEPPLKRKLYWHHPAVYLLLFFNILVYVIVAMILRKRCSAEICLCTQHRNRRRSFTIAGWVGGIGGLALATIGMGDKTTWLIILGFVAFIGFTLAGLIGASVVRTARIRQDTIWLTGVGQEFRDSLPEWIA